MYIFKYMCNLYFFRNGIIIIIINHLKYENIIFSYSLTTLGWINDNRIFIYG